MTTDWYSDVLAFHEKFGCAIGDKPAVPSQATVDLRKDLIDEEINRELFPAMDAGDLPKIADALVDAAYVLIGTAIAYGIDLRPIWNEVHYCNMQKVGGGKRADGKILKPEGWKGPRIGALLAEQAGEDPPCACPATCGPACKGECGCERCRLEYMDFLSAE